MYNANYRDYRLMCIEFASDLVCGVLCVGGPNAVLRCMYYHAVL